MMILLALQRLKDMNDELTAQVLELQQQVQTRNKSEHSGSQTPHFSGSRIPIREGSFLSDYVKTKRGVRSSVSSGKVSPQLALLHLYIYGLTEPWDVVAFSRLSCMIDRKNKTPSQWFSLLPPSVYHYLYKLWVCVNVYIFLNFFIYISLSWNWSLCCVYMYQTVKCIFNKAPI